MIRQPTTLEPLYAWHRLAIASHVPITVTDEPQLGWYRRRLVRDGAFVAAIIFLDQVVDQDGELVEPERVRCLVNGREFEPADQWLWLSKNPITEQEFEYMTRFARWARAYGKEEPEADPTKAIDWNQMPLAF